MKTLVLVLGTAFGIVGCEAHLNVLSRSERSADGGSALDEAGHAPSRATDISAGFSETCAALGSALACWGTLPDGRVTNVPELVPEAGSARWQRISSGQRAHCGVQAGGSVWCFGVNDMGQLAQGDQQTRLSPAPVPLPSAAARVRGRFGTFCARLEDGALYCWGGNAEGQLGQSEPFTGPAPDARSPVRVGNTNDVTDADSGQGHTCFIRSGELWCMGRNTENELGLGAGADVQIRTPTRVGDGADWTAIATGQGFSCGIRAPGALYCWGDGRDGQLGQGMRTIVDSPTRIGSDADWTAIDIDTFHACGLRSPGTLHCWGRNAEGQLGLGDVNDRDVPVAVGSFSDWIQIAVGRFHTCARRSDAAVWCTGDNDDGRLGTGDFDRRNVLTPVNLP